MIKNHALQGNNAAFEAGMRLVIAQLWFKVSCRGRVWVPHRCAVQ